MVVRIVMNACHLNSGSWPDHYAVHLMLRLPIENCGHPQGVTKLVIGSFSKSTVVGGRAVEHHGKDVVNGLAPRRVERVDDDCAAWRHETQRAVMGAGGESRSAFDRPIGIYAAQIAATTSSERLQTRASMTRLVAGKEYAETATAVIDIDIAPATIRVDEGADTRSVWQLS
jgi:hypothetical protein